MSGIDVENYLAQKGDFRRSGSEMIGYCPSCNARHERSLSVNTETGQWVCNRKSNCGASGGFAALQVAYGDKPVRNTNILDMPPRTYTDPKRSAKAIKADGVEFLTSRGLNDLTVAAWRCGQAVSWFRKLNAEGEGVCWPVYGPDGNLVNVKSRALLAKDFNNQKGCAQWPVGLHLVDVAINGKSVTFTEGELDAMSLYQLGQRNVCSLPNGAGDQTWIDLAWDWLAGFDTIYLCVDTDKAGQDAQEKIIRRLGYQWSVRVVTMPGGHKDANEALAAGVTREQIAAAFAGAREITPDTVFRADHYTEAVIALLRNRNKMTGFSSGFSTLDALTHGFRGSELSVWTGQSGSGKSTVLGQIIVNSLRDGVKTCISSLEIPPQFYASWLALQACGDGDPTDSMAERAMRWMGTGLYFIHRVTSSALDDMLNDWAYCAQRYGCKQFVVDPLQCIEAGQDEYAAQAKIVQGLLRFARQYDVHVHLVAHPKKLESDTAAIGQNSVKGNKAITDLAHNIFAVVRGATATVIQVLKVREYGVAMGASSVLTVDANCKQVFDASSGSPDFWPWIDDVEGNIPAFDDPIPPRRTTAEPDWMNTAEPLTERRPA